MAGDITIWFDYEYPGWMFKMGEYDCVFLNEKLDISVVDRSKLALNWIELLKNQINSEVMKNLEGWVKWEGDPTIINIDVTDLITESKIDVSYCGDESWGDLGVNIVIKDGNIIESYSGD